MNFTNRKQKNYKQALTTPAGEYLLASLLDFSGFYRQSFSSDPYQTAFNEGKRSVALHLIQFLDLKEEDLRNLVRGYRTEMSTEFGDM
jgi:hypothetical protein